MGEVRFTKAVPATIPVAFDAALSLYSELGYRVEEADRMGYKLVFDRGSSFGALFGGAVRKRRVWVTIRFSDQGGGLTEARFIYDGWGKAVNDDARTAYEGEVAQFAAWAEQAQARAGAGAAAPAPKEVIVKEIVRIPCKYCGAHVDNTARKCPDCGGPMN